jgi:hypothetical protein
MQVQANAPHTANDDSRVIVGKSGAAAYVGPDAVDLFRVKQIRTFIKLHQSCGMIPTRGVTITKLLAAATAITGKPYKGATKHAAAIADLTAHIDATLAGMPITVE